MLVDIIGERERRGERERKGGKREAVRTFVFLLALVVEEAGVASSESVGRGRGEKRESERT
jgi:hypothetical protein